MRIYLTLDYELYNGIKSGSVQNCLIYPMEQLQSILSKFELRITIFVDACFLLKLNQLRSNYDILENDWQAIVTQLKSLSEYGHDIQLHLHPQWLRAKFDGTLWTSNLEDYKLSDLSPDEVDKLFADSIILLKSIIGKDIVAFRAGAYSIQTLKNISGIFNKNEILIDSSVLRHKKSITACWEYFDYTHIPDKYVYKFSDNVTREDNEGIFYELSIPTFKTSKVQLLKQKLLLRTCNYSNIPWGDGIGSIGTLDKGMNKMKRLIKKYIGSLYISSSVDGISAVFLSYIYKKLKSEGVDDMVIIGHPKGFTPFSLYQFEQFVQTVVKNDSFEVVSTFIKR